MAERSLAHNPRCGHAVHSLAHVFYETNDHATGATFLRAWMANYERNGPMHCHLAWHQALFELSMGSYARVMELYEDAICPDVARTRTSMYDAASLLWRFQIYGCAQDALPWSAVGELAARMTAQPGMAFVDANAALALAAVGDEVAFCRLIDGLRALEAQGHPTAGSVVLPLVQGIWAFAPRRVRRSHRVDRAHRRSDRAYRWQQCPAGGLRGHTCWRPICALGIMRMPKRYCASGSVDGPRGATFSGSDAPR